MGVFEKEGRSFFLIFRKESKNEKKGPSLLLKNPFYLQKSTTSL